MEILVVPVEFSPESLESVLKGEYNQLTSDAGNVVFATIVNTVYFEDRVALDELGLVKQ